MGVDAGGQIVWCDVRFGARICVLANINTGQRLNERFNRHFVNCGTAVREMQLRIYMLPLCLLTRVFFRLKLCSAYVKKSP